LNNVTYTRWRFGGPARTPDAILVMVPGFGGGAGNFEALAENLITRELEDHGLVVELWGYDRRTEQLEDRAGALLAGQLADPLVALDWYYGAELGLTLHPALVAGPNRRAEFYNTADDVPFLANWTSLVFSRDIDAVVQSARGTALGHNVFLGGHSAGTGFAARYAATDFNLTGVGLPDPGYTRLRGVLLFEGTGGRRQRHRSRATRSTAWRPSSTAGSTARSATPTRAASTARRRARSRPKRRTASARRRPSARRPRRHTA
jgi:pimeloyl-ACP methyl ester carboxylesterase